MATWTSQERFALVVDAKGLRRDAIARRIGAWLEGENLAVIGVTPQDAIDQPSLESRCEIVIYSCGAEQIDAAEHRRWVKVLTALAGKAPLVIISDREDTQDVVAAMTNGARAYLPTSMDPHVAQAAISFVLQGGSYFPPSALQGIGRGADDGGIARNGGGGKSQGAEAVARGGKPKEEAASPINLSAAPLTEGQRNVLSLLQGGSSNKEIARELSMSEATVKAHVRKIMRKLGVTNRTQAALVANENLGPLATIQFAELHS